MKARSTLAVAALVMGIGMAFRCTPAYGEAPESLEGLDGVKMVFDIRLADPKKLSLFLSLIQRTYRDKDMRGLEEKPRFVVVFNGPSVTLVADPQHEVSPEEAEHRQDIKRRVAEMAQAGIDIEACLIAAEIFKVDPDRFYPDITRINNAWVSLAGHQAHAYSLIPVF